MIADDVGFLRGSGLIFCFCGVRDAIEVDIDHSLPGAVGVECSMARKSGNTAIFSISPVLDADFCFTIKKDFISFHKHNFQESPPAAWTR